MTFAYTRYLFKLRHARFHILGLRMINGQHRNKKVAILARYAMMINMNTKKTLKYAGISLIATASLLMAMTARTLFVRFPHVQAWNDKNTEYPENFIEYVNKLSGGLKIPTVSYEDLQKTDFSKFAEFRTYLQNQYPTVFKNMEHFLIDNNSVILIWRGTNSDLKPIMFNAHYDVVPAKEEDFSGAVKDDKIYGRGAIDMKSTLFALMNSADALISNGFKPQRDMYFVFGYDEETNQVASKGIAKYLKSKNIQFDAIYDEGGMVNVMNIDGNNYGFAFVGVAEKGYLTLHINVSANGGHSSMPHHETASGNAAKIISRLEKNQMSPRISQDTDNGLRTLAAVSGFANRFVIANRDILKPIVTNILSDDPITNAAIRTTTAVTSIHGGDADNVIPSVVRIVVNFRLNPGDKIEDVIKHVKKQCAGFNVKIDTVQNWDASKVSSTNTHGFKKSTQTIKSIFPDANIVPYTTVGSTDSRNYGEISDNIYRFMPVAMNASERELIHAEGENISIKNYAKMNSYFKLLISGYDRDN